MLGEDIQRSFQPLFVFWREVKFADNGQSHRLDYTPLGRISRN